MGDAALKADLDQPRITQKLTSSAADIAHAAALLRGGQLVAFPTETVYGLGADATCPQAVARIFAAKGRPRFNPLIAHVPDLAAARALAPFSPIAEALAQAFWPGPLTLVLPALPDCPVCELTRAGLDTLAIRVPSHPVARAILQQAGRPIAAPSANRSGHISPTLAAHVEADLNGEIEALLDGGACDIGLESTILGVFGDDLVLLRPGGITREALEALTGRIVRDAPHGADDDAPLAPGRLSSHYAPSKPLRLNVMMPNPRDGYLAFGEAPAHPQLLNLSPTGDLIEAAANLYHHLRALDHCDIDAISVAPLPETGIGEALLDRLMRAAAPRP